MLIEEAALHHAIRNVIHTSSDVYKKPLHGPGNLSARFEPPCAAVADYVEKLFHSRICAFRASGMGVAEVMRSYLEQPGLQARLTIEQR